MNNPLIEFTDLEQKSAANPNDWVWANANAGSGKTKVLIDRIARILLHGSDPAKILAVTYTKAAAAEMTTRLFETLGKWTITKDDELRKILKGLDSNLQCDAAQLSKARALFASALETPGGLKVQTIHAFCGDILKRFPIEAGIAPGFEVADDLLANDLKERAERIAKTKCPEIFAEVNANIPRNYSKSAIYEIGAKIDPKAGFDVKDLEKRLFRAFGYDKVFAPDEEIESAIDSFDKAILKSIVATLQNSESEKDTAFGEAFGAALSDGKTTAFQNILALILTTKKELTKLVPISAEARKNPIIKSFFGEAKRGEGWNLGAFAQFWEHAQKVEIARLISRSIILNVAANEWRKAFDEIKSRLGRLDFSDLLIHTSSLLNRDEGAALWVMYKLDQGLEHILIDESQDTSEEQWQILRPLLASLENETHKTRRTGFVVGDDKQSIYSFQGADPDAYRKEKIQFLKANSAKEVKFSVSFRTGDTILSMVDKVWHEACEYEIETEIPAHAPSNIIGTFQNAKNQNRSHFSARLKQGASVELWDIIKGKEKENDRAAWDIPLDVQSENDAKSKLAQTIASEIKARITNGELVWEKGKCRPCLASDFMILVKARNSLFHRIIKNLKKEGIAVAGSDLIILKDEPAILDLLAFLQFIARPEDDFNLACLLKSAFFNLVRDDEHLFELCYKRKQCLYLQLRDSHNLIHNEIFKCLGEIRKKCAALPVFEILSFILNTKIYGDKTGWDWVFNRFGVEAKEPVEILLDLAIDAQKNDTQTLNAFIDFIENRAPTAKREFDANEDGVKVMTVHGSKGREAPIVILPDTTRGRGYDKSGIQYWKEVNAHIFTPDLAISLEKIETLKEIAKVKQAKEDQRLLYVAMTRAKDRLILCGHQFRKTFEKDSWYAVFERAFYDLDGFERQPLQIRNYEFETPYAKIWGQIKGEVLPLAKGVAPEVITVPEWVRVAPKPFDPPPKRIAPSALIDENYELPSISPISGDTKNRFARGTIIHQLLETLPQIPPENRQEYAQKIIRRNKEFDDAQKTEIIVTVFKTLNDKDLGAIFGANSRAEVAIIGKSPALPKDIIINGTIDRMIITDKEILILDYKTNRPPPKTIMDTPKQYINQMAAYYAVLREAFKDKEIRCALLWTDGPMLAQIPQTMIELALSNFAAAD